MRLHGNYQAEVGIRCSGRRPGRDVSGIGDVLHAFARAMRPAERARLLDLLEVLIVSVGHDSARATVPKALRSILEQPPPARLRVIAGGKSARMRGWPAGGGAR